MRLTADERDHIWQRDRGRCRWPTCNQPGAEVAHAHSRGMGGRPSANTPANLLLLCRTHARISDGEYGPGGRAEYAEAHQALGIELEPAWSLAWRRAEALTQLIDNP